MLKNAYRVSKKIDKTDVFEGKFPFCDVARGQIGKSLSFMKGNPPYRSLIIE